VRREAGEEGAGASPAEARFGQAAMRLDESHAGKRRRVRWREMAQRAQLVQRSHRWWHQSLTAGLVHGQSAALEQGGAESAARRLDRHCESRGSSARDDDVKLVTHGALRE